MSEEENRKPKRADEWEVNDLIKIRLDYRNYDGKLPGDLFGGNDADDLANESRQPDESLHTLDEMGIKTLQDLKPLIKSKPDGSKTAKIAFKMIGRLFIDRSVLWNMIDAASTVEQRLHKKEILRKRAILEPEWQVNDLIKDRLDYRNYDGKLPRKLYYLSADDMKRTFKEGEVDGYLGDLDKMKIKTLQNIKPFLDDEDDSQEVQNVLAIVGSLRIRDSVLLKMIDAASTVEQRLHEKEILHFGGSGREELQVIDQRFSKDVVPIHHICRFDSTNRDPNIALVLGPSGSGKTFFSVKSIKSVWPRPQDNQSTPNYRHQCTLYTVLTSISGTPKQVGKKICEKIKEALEDFDSQFCKENELNMMLWIVLDEAYTLQYMNFGSNLTEPSQRKITFEMLDEIRGELTNLAQAVRVVFAGTGLDELTTQIGSQSQAPKFRMKQWGIDNLKAIVKKQFPDENENNNPNTRMLNDFIMGDELYLQLSTNARAAFYLFQSALNVYKCSPPKSVVDVILRQVAHKYISSNGLADIKKKQDIRIARAVFQVLDHASRPSSKPTWPLDNVEMDPNERRLVLALLEINIELGDNGWYHIGGDDKYNASVSPSIAIVLFYMLGIFSHLDVLDWGAFESLVARHELQQLLVESLIDEDPKLGMQQLKDPFPPTQSPPNDEIFIPIVRKGFVVINGRQAPFVDVIVRNRLIQCKYTEKFDESIDLNLDEELINMGLCHESTEWQKLSMAALLKTFEISEKDLPSIVVPNQRSKENHVSVADYGDPTNDGESRCVYPNSLFLRRAEKEACGFIKCLVVKDHNDKPTQVTMGSIGSWDGCVIALDRLKANCFQNLVFAFYTNAKSFDIPHTDINISVSDVDWDGQIVDETPVKKLLEEYLDKLNAFVGVEALRFQFVPGSFKAKGDTQDNGSIPKFQIALHITP